MYTGIKLGVDLTNICLQKKPPYLTRKLKHMHIMEALKDHLRFVKQEPLY